MWYSFLGTTLTILFGILISYITEKVSKTKVMSISKSVDDKLDKKEATIFTIEKYRRKSQALNIHLHGIDNIAVKVEDEI